MDDLLGLGKGADKLLAVVERAVGAFYRPYGIRRDADAEDYKLRLLDATKRESNSKDVIEAAKAQVKANMILAEGEQELEARTQARLRHEAMRQQQNIERIVAGALSDMPPEVSTADVDDDWLTSFFEQARTVSGADMQALWSRVLAREVGMPGTFSPRSLDVLRKMTRQEADAFKIACQLACVGPRATTKANIYCGAVCSWWMSYSESPEVDLGNFGLSYLDRVNLAQIGLLYDDTLVSARGMPRGTAIFIEYASVKLKLVAKKKNLLLRSYSLTPIGTELSALVSEEEIDAYIEALCSSLSRFFNVSRVDHEGA